MSKPVSDEPEMTITAAQGASMDENLRVIVHKLNVSFFL